MPDLIVKTSDGIGRITINRPQARNSMPSTMYGQIHEALRGFERDPEVRAVLITGEGAHFCAGGDVKEFGSTVELTDQQRALKMSALVEEANAIMQVIERMPQPVLVSARGMAVGGGLALMLNADLAIISETCKMVSGQIAIGGIPDMCLSYNLVRLLGPRRAKQYGFLGDPIDAATALDLGLVNWVVPDDELDARAEELAARLAKGPVKALALTKQAMNAAHTATLADHVAREPNDVAECVLNDAFSQAIQIMVAKISK